MDHSNILLKFTNVSKNYNSTKVLEDINLEIYRNTINVVMGPNGAGKSQLSKIIVNLNAISSGSKINYAKNITYIPQKIHFTQYLPMSVEKFMYYMIQKPTIENKKIIELLNNFCDLKKNQKKQIVDLSGGTLQKIFIAQALMQQYDLIVMDEPTQHLDIQSESELYKIIIDIKNTCGSTFVLVSHDIHTVLKFADQIICINNHICCTGHPSIVNVDDPFVSLYRHHHNHKH